MISLLLAFLVLVRIYLPVCGQARQVSDFHAPVLVGLHDICPLHVVFCSFARELGIGVVANDPFKHVGVDM